MTLSRLQVLHLDSFTCGKAANRTEVSDGAYPIILCYSQSAHLDAHANQLLSTEKRSNASLASSSPHRPRDYKYT
jgi:hypothetical protein